MWRPLGEEQLLHLSDDQMMQSFPNLVLVLKWEEECDLGRPTYIIPSDLRVSTFEERCSFLYDTSLQMLLVY